MKQAATLTSQPVEVTMPMILTGQQHREALSRATSNMNAQEELAFLRAFVVELEEQVDWLLSKLAEIVEVFSEVMVLAAVAQCV